MKLNGQEVELKYGVNAIRALIRETKQTPLQIMQGGFDPSDLELGISMIWAGMLWSNKKITPDMVGDWIENAEPGAYLEAVTEAVQGFTVAFTRAFVAGTGNEDGKGKN